MPSQWSIQFWPRVGCHVFLSHCAEDRQRLIVPVHERLREQHITSWVDWHWYPSGRGVIAALQDAILRCRHVAYFITPASLRQGRGWNVVERTLAALVQARLMFGGSEFQHLELPLLFVERGDPILQRSAWAPLLERAVAWKLTRQAGETRITWAARQIAAFCGREKDWSEDVRERLRGDDAAHQSFSSEDNLLRRVHAVDPVEL